VQGSDVNKTVTLTVTRNGQSMDLNATLLESK
jgi:S1-C subfamily serine protease